MGSVIRFVIVSFALVLPLAFSATLALDIPVGEQTTATNHVELAVARGDCSSVGNSLQASALSDAIFHSATRPEIATRIDTSTSFSFPAYGDLYGSLIHGRLSWPLASASSLVVKPALLTLVTQHVRLQV